MERWIVGIAALLALLIGSLMGAWDVVTSRREPAASVGKPATVAPPHTTSEPKGIAPAPGEPEEDPMLDRAGVQPLIENLRSPEWQVRFLAAKALAAIGPEAKDAVPALLAALRDEEWRSRYAAAGALAKVAPAAPEIISTLIQHLHEGDAALRAVAARTLSLIGPPAISAVPALTHTASYQDEAVRHNVARALGDIKPPAEQAVPTLVLLLRDESSKVRYKAAESLGKLGPDAKDALVPLMEALDDRDKATRHFASISILRMGAVAIPHLARYIEDEKHVVMRSWACEALASYGAAAEEALPALRKATQSKDRTVRDAAAAAIQQIETQIKLKADNIAPPAP